MFKQKNREYVLLKNWGKAKPWAIEHVPNRGKGNKRPKTIYTYGTLKNIYKKLLGKIVRYTGSISKTTQKYTTNKAYIWLIEHY